MRPTQDEVAIGNHYRLVDGGRLIDGGMVPRIVSTLVFDSATNAIHKAQEFQVAPDAPGNWPLLPAPRSCLAQ